MGADVRLRETTEADFPILFEQQKDPLAIHMAAFTAEHPDDWNGFVARWSRNLRDPSTVNRTILVGDDIAGSIVSYVAFGEREIGYELGREYWGKGIATSALRSFLTIVRERPLFARAAQDNVASLRVLQKCGFAITGENVAYANGRAAQTAEFILTLAADETATETPSR